MGYPTRSRSYVAMLGSLTKERGVDLTLVASDTTDREMPMLHHRTAPKVPAVWAVRMSMSIPFVWREVLWQKEWGTYLPKRELLRAAGADTNIQTTLRQISGTFA